MEQHAAAREHASGQSCGYRDNSGGSSVVVTSTVASNDTIATRWHGLDNMQVHEACGSGFWGALAALRKAAIRFLRVGRSSSTLSPATRPVDTGLWLRITSPCEGSMTHLAVPRRQRALDAHWAAGDKGGSVRTAWDGFCAVCKRPISMTLAAPPAGREFAKRSRHSEAETGPCAFVVALWGSSPEYVLGAMVLAWSLRCTRTRHDLVMVHTNDVSDAALDLLRRAGWNTREIQHVSASESLSNDGCSTLRFANVFTKLRVLELVEYSKILMMDIDLLVCENIDDLFDLEAPAAMVRGPEVRYEHGEQVCGRYFFAGSRPDGYSWGQASGINAGVMLLRPDKWTFEQMVSEVLDERHPEHIRGNGPEQDYLSRFYASDWSHISVAYNFQLHHVYFALNPVCMATADRTKFIFHPELIKVFHYSSEPKPWTRCLEEQYFNLTEEEWLNEVLMSFTGYRAWVLKEDEHMRREGMRAGLVVGPDGRLYNIDWKSVESSRQERAGCLENPSTDSRATRVANDNYDVDLGHRRVASSEVMLGVEKPDEHEEREVGKEQELRLRHDDNSTHSGCQRWGSADSLDQHEGRNCCVDGTACKGVEDPGLSRTGKDSGANPGCRDECSAGFAPAEDTMRRHHVLEHETYSRASQSTGDGRCQNYCDDGRKRPGHDDDDANKGGVFSEDGWPLGELADVPVVAIEAARNVIKHAQDLWFGIYKELAEELGEPDLCGIVRLACAGPVIRQDWDWSSQECSVRQNDEKNTENYNFGSRWECNDSGDWWVERPISGRFVATCGILPQTYASLSVGGSLLLSASGQGVHAAAISPTGATCPQPQSFPAGTDGATAAFAWAEAVPHRAMVMLAAIDTNGDQAGLALEALSRAGLGCPFVMPPSGCVVAAAVGRKGDSRWYATHAAADVALATCAACRDGTVVGAP